MKFLVSSKENFSRSTVAIIIQDGADTIFHTELPGGQDNVAGWYTSFRYLRKTQPQELNELLGAIPQLLEIQVDEDAQPTYLNMLYALFKWAEEEKHELQEQSSTENDIPNLYGLHQPLKYALFNFEVKTLPNNEYYEAIFPYPGQEKFPVRILSDKFDKSPVQTGQVMLKKAHERDPKYIEYFISHHLHFQEYVISADQTTFNVFTGLSKALVKLIMQENANLGVYISLVPDICTFIVKNELDSEEQKEYLEPIFSSFETVEQKLKRLNGIITDVKSEIYLRRIPHPANVRQFKEDGYRRLMHVISIISGHYLNIYDLDRSTNFWDKVEGKNLMLRFFLALHRRPHLFVIIQLLLLGILSLFIYQHWHVPLHPPYVLPLLLLLIWYVPLLFLLVALLQELLHKSHKSFLYSQLLLPRIFGASIVGLVPLLLNDQSWLIGIQSSPINWILLSLLAYSGSFLYIYLEVANKTKFVQRRSKASIFGTSMKIFLIAFTETLFVVAVTSTLIFPSVIPSLSGLSGNEIGIFITTPLLSLGFFPTLIILWTAIALFIGSFVQLLWQGRRITEPI